MYRCGWSPAGGHGPPKPGAPKSVRVSSAPAGRRGLRLALEELDFFSREVRILGVYPQHPYRWQDGGGGEAE